MAHSGNRIGKKTYGGRFAPAGWPGVWWSGSGQAEGAKGQAW